MSEAPTHSAAVPARPQQTSQQNPQQMPQQTERSPQTERVQQAERQAEKQAERHEERTPQSQTQTQSQPPRADQREHRAERQEQREQRTEQREQRTEQREQRTSSRLEDEWQAVQYEFVDDPKAAVRKADELVTRALEELNTRHRSLTDQLKGNGDPQTEDLRLALHRYRELFKSLVAVK